MNLPNYFLADLPPEATLSPAMITEACQTLKRNRAHYLAARSTDGMVQSAGRAWRRAGWNRQYPSASCAGSRAGRNRFFRGDFGDRAWTIFSSNSRRENFQRLLRQEFGDAAAAGRFSARATIRARVQPRRALARRPGIARRTSLPGNIPNPTLTGMVLGLLTRSAQFVKCASGSSFLPRLFAHSIYDADAETGRVPGNRRMARRQRRALEGGLVCRSRLRGGDRQRRNARGDSRAAAGQDPFSRLRPSRQFRFRGRRSVARLAPKKDRGGGGGRRGGVEPAWLSFAARHLCGGRRRSRRRRSLPNCWPDELERREQTEPRGELAAEHAAAIASRRGIYEVRAAHSPETTRHWCSKNSTAWTVVYEADTRFQMSCLNRFIYVKAVADLTAALQGADEIRGKVSTVGLAAPEEKTDEIAAQLARWGATRVCPLGQMQNPPLAWRHDGRPALGDLVTWTDLEIE